jgi:hypothetical protein
MHSFNQLLGNITPLKDELILSYFQKKPNRPALLLSIKSPIPLNGFYNLFQAKDSIMTFIEIFEESMNISDEQFLDWWNEQPMVLQEESLIELIVSSKEYKSIFINDSKTSPNYKTSPIFQHYFINRDLNILHAMYTPIISSQ